VLRDSTTETIVSHNQCMCKSVLSLGMYVFGDLTSYHLPALLEFLLNSSRSNCVTLFSMNIRFLTCHTHFAVYDRFLTFPYQNRQSVSCAAGSGTQDTLMLANVSQCKFLPNDETVLRYWCRSKHHTCFALNLLTCCISSVF
jgi:hypothetical protein